MLAESAVVAIAVTCVAVCIVGGIAGTLLWVRIRQQRASVSWRNYGRRGYGMRVFPGETVTEVSREEGSILDRYGQLPLGRPNEWGVLESQDSLVQPASDSSSQLLDKPGYPVLVPNRQSRLLRPHRINSLTALTETIEKPVTPISKGVTDGVSISAVDGALELPAETSPRHTPDREERNQDAYQGMRPISGPGPSVYQREHSNGLFPVMEDRYESFDIARSRARGGSITAQAPGIAPEHPVPPPPCAYPPNRFRLSKNDSARFSSLSLETADSSILDESRGTSGGMDSDFTSPALPPCPTFAPYSANDVGRSVALSYPTVPATFIFPSSPPTVEGLRLEPDRTSPRRSLTARSPTSSMERISTPPRRSESLSARPARREPIPYTDLDRIAPLNVVGRNPALLPHFSQLQRHSIHAGQRRENDLLHGGIGNMMTNPGRAGALASAEGYLQVPGAHLKVPLASAMKGGSGPRKGHRRQNCVRISIHPPITFGGPAFAPTVEEPEELDEFDMRTSEVGDMAASNISSLRSSVSTLAARVGHEEERDGFRVTDVSGGSVAPSYRSTSCKHPAKKRKHGRNESIDSVMSVTNNADSDKSLPEIVTTLPPSTDSNMSKTPSPEKVTPIWMPSNSNCCPTTYENTPNPGSPRRSAVKGPRTQPGRPVRNSMRSYPLDDSMKVSSPPGRPRSQSMRNGSSRRSTEFLQRAKSSVVGSPRSYHRISNEHSHDLSDSSPGQQRHLHSSDRPPSRSASKASSSHNQIVTIWEDQDLSFKRQSMRRSMVLQENGPAELHGESTPQRPERRQSRTQPPMLKTPTKKTVGLGIAATPGSLYDGDGFLKE
ncbi:hypothetical protein BDV25DRAFT_65645 [Aspergillus avenaceus]|uniref:Uncharacterized protein n=1 Tax=Aspergillus avenaceus TaxID=36643 RepID=A0A5N6U1V9_ASPAV|nr:hypothetical protein BDV25DRAFT_65645 [Aspergillus avenaceus]